MFGKKVVIKPIHEKKFQSEGRGPELVRVIWAYEGRLLKAFEYFNSEDEHNDENIHHIQVIRPQVVMCTPEEVINFGDFKPSGFENASAFDCGKSSWLLGFSQMHLEKCRHFKLLFYDQLYDLIAEELVFKDGAFKEIS